MKKISYKRIYQSQEYLAPLGVVRSRSLFGGYSLSVNNTVFAMVSEGELYLRACEETAVYQRKVKTPLLTLKKRGGPLQLNYFHVDETLWQNHKLLLRLSKLSLKDALREKNGRQVSQRLKDLPNLSFHMELLMAEAGIKNVADLRLLGAKDAWAKLRRLRENLSVGFILSLEGALTGVHAAAVPLSRRDELIDWASALNIHTPAQVD